MSLTLNRIFGRCKRIGECRIWPLCCNSSGQPQASDGASRRGIPLRREVYRLAVDEIQAGHEIMMTCGVSACLEPRHMLAVTRKERMQRAAQAGKVSTPAFVLARTKTAREASAFSLERAEEFRKRAANRKRGDLKKLAAEFGISIGMASKIVLGKAWNKPPEPESVKVQRVPGCAARTRFEPPPWFKGEFSREWQHLRASNDETIQAA